MIGNKTVVYTSGTFDMLHINHLKMIVLLLLTIKNYMPILLELLVLQRTFLEKKLLFHYYKNTVLLKLSMRQLKI